VRASASSRARSLWVASCLLLFCHVTSASRVLLNFEEPGAWGNCVPSAIEAQMPNGGFEAAIKSPSISGAANGIAGWTVAHPAPSRTT
jgi:hypothetical protein